MLKFNKSIFSVFLLALFIIPQAHAGLLLDPYIGLSFAGKLEQKSSTLPITGDYSGVQMGGRVGYSMLGFMGGLTANIATNTDAEMTKAFSRSNDGITRRDIRAFVGFNFPILVRVWGSYYFMSEVSGQDPGFIHEIDSTESLNGNGYGIGVGFTGLPFISLNLELRNFTYDELEDINLNPATSILSPEYTGSEIFISISAPFDL